MEARDVVKRKIIVYIATSADGFIARKNGDIDWLDRPRAAGDYGMADFYRSIDTILWGRKTYDVVLKMQKDGVKGATFDPHVKNYLFSRRMRSRPPQDHRLHRDQRRRVHRAAQRRGRLARRFSTPAKSTSSWSTSSRR